MSADAWPPSFDKLIRSYLDLGDDQVLTAEMLPSDHGLDSMATVSLLLDLEERYSVTFADDQLPILATADVGGLWALLESLGGKRDE